MAKESTGGELVCPLTAAGRLSSGFRSSWRLWAPVEANSVVRHP
jgi:hypothetical protein